MWIARAKTASVRVLLWSLRRGDLNFGGGVLPVRKFVHLELGLKRLRQLFGFIRADSVNPEVERPDRIFFRARGAGPKSDVRDKAIDLGARMVDYDEFRDRALVVGYHTDSHHLDIFLQRV